MDYTQHKFKPEHTRDDDDVYYHTLCGEMIHGQDHVDMMHFADNIIMCEKCKEL